MFEELLGLPPQQKQPNIEAMKKAEVEAEQRQVDYNREQTLTQANLDPNNDVHDLNIKEQRSDLIRWQQELGDELRSLVFTLKGVVEKDGQIIPTTAPMCNNFFIYSVVIPQCTPFISRNLINTNYSEKQILLNFRMTMDEVCDAMADNYDMYDIDFKNYDLVMRLIKNTIKPSLYRSLDGFTKNKDTTITRRIEGFHDNNSGQATSDKKLFGLV